MKFGQTGEKNMCFHMEISLKPQDKIRAKLQGSKVRSQTAPMMQRWPWTSKHVHMLVSITCIKNIFLVMNMLFSHTQMWNVLRNNLVYASSDLITFFGFYSWFTSFFPIFWVNVTLRRCSDSLITESRRVSSQHLK